VTVDFTSQSTGEIIAWDWDFGDGTSGSEEEHPSHQYSVPGDYTVSLTVVGPGGCDTQAEIDLIHVDALPVVGFTSDRTSGRPPLTIDFRDRSMGAITEWDWDFGDGSPHSSEPDPVHTYTAEGTYTVTLTLTAACGSISKIETDYIRVAEDGLGCRRHRYPKDGPDEDGLPSGPIGTLEVSGCTPNPFSLTTSLSIAVPRATYVQTVVYDLTGREVARLVDRELTQGIHTVVWDGTGPAGRPVASGVYFFHVVTGGETATRKTLLTR